MDDKYFSMVQEEYAKICEDLHICADEEGIPIGDTGKKYRQTLVIYENVTDFIKRNFLAECARLIKDGVPAIRVLDSLMRSCSQDAYLNSPLTLFVEDMAENTKTNTIVLKLKFIQDRLESILNPNFDVSDDEIREFINMTIRINIGNGLVLINYLMTSSFDAYKKFIQESQKLMNQRIEQLKPEESTEENLVRIMYSAPFNRLAISLTKVDIKRYYELCEKLIW